jgi:hypothetical protein
MGDTPAAVTLLPQFQIGIGREFSVLAKRAFVLILTIVAFVAKMDDVNIVAEETNDAATNEDTVNELNSFVKGTYLLSLILDTNKACVDTVLVCKNPVEIDDTLIAPNVPIVAVIDPALIVFVDNEIDVRAPLIFNVLKELINPAAI